MKNKTEQFVLIALIIIIFVGFYITTRGSGVSLEEEQCIPDYIGGCN